MQYLVSVIDDTAGLAAPSSACNRKIEVRPFL